MAAKGLSEQAFYVLAALADEPRHGYGIVRTVRELTEDRLTLRVGTLYGVLDRLVTDGHVQPDREEVVDGRLRRYYRITPDGRTALTLDAQRQQANARIAAHRLGAAWRPATDGGTA